jgi:hypothetical protein
MDVMARGRVLHGIDIVTCLRDRYKNGSHRLWEFPHFSDIMQCWQYFCTRRNQKLIFSHHQTAANWAWLSNKIKREYLDYWTPLVPANKLHLSSRLESGDSLPLSLSPLFHLTLIMKPQNTCRFPKVVSHVPPPGSMHLSPGMLTFTEESLVQVSNNNRTSPPIIYFVCTLYCTLSVIVPHIWVERISFYISLDVQIKHPRWTQSHVGLGTECSFCWWKR